MQICIDRITTFQCDNCGCHDHGIPFKINKLRNKILGNQISDQFYFIPINGIHDHLKYKDTICRVCLQLFEKQGIIKKILEKNQYFICSKCHVYQDIEF